MSTTGTTGTVIIIADELENEMLIKNIADDILMKGCKNIALCGEASDLGTRDNPFT